MAPSRDGPTGLEGKPPNRTAACEEKSEPGGLIDQGIGERDRGAAHTGLGLVDGQQLVVVPGRLDDLRPLARPWPPCDLTDGFVVLRQEGKVFDGRHARFRAAGSSARWWLD